jgi:hypothetical protein
VGRIMIEMSTGDEAAGVGIQNLHRRRLHVSDRAAPTQILEPY